MPCPCMWGWWFGPWFGLGWLGWLVNVLLVALLLVLVVVVIVWAVRALARDAQYSARSHGACGG